MMTMVGGEEVKMSRNRSSVEVASSDSCRASDRVYAGINAAQTAAPLGDWSRLRKAVPSELIAGDEIFRNRCGKAVRLVSTSLERGESVGSPVDLA